MADEKTTVTMREAASFYLRGYFKQSKFAWLTFAGWMIGRVLTYSVPSLLISKILNNLQAGSFEKQDQFAILIFALVLVIVGEFIIRLTGHFMAHFQVRQSDKILKDSYDNLLSKSLGFHADNFAGTLTTKLNRLSRGSVEFSDTLHFNVSDIIGFLLFTIAVLGLKNPIPVIISISAMIIYALIAAPFIKKRLVLVKGRAAMESKRTGLLVDGITNIMTIKSFAQEEQELSDFAEHVDKTGDLTVKTWLYNNWRLDPITATFYTLLTFGPLGIVIYSAGQESSVGDLFLTYALFSVLAVKIWDFSRIWRNLERQLAEAVEGLEILYEPGDVKDSASATVLDVKEGEVVYSGVNFSYQNEELFKNFNLSIPTNQSVGLIGPSGGGKSTFMKLVLRFMDVDSGSIDIDGQNLADITQSSLRSNLSYIPQEPLLFHRSILENITYGNREATKKEVVSAAKKAYAHEFIESLPHGYETLVGERGIKLSGGQRQRIAIARAFLKDAPILVLDEATSALDSESEKLIQESLLKLMKGKTSIVIAHRLSTIKHLDRVIVLDNGEIVQDGTHEELSKQKGLYKTLWSHQSGGFLQD